MLNWIEAFFYIVEIVGTVAFAASAAMIAIDRELDMFGVLFLGICAATGGGMMRDLFLGITPPGAFRDPTYVAVGAATALIVFLFAWRNKRLYRREYALLDRVVNLLDAIGLGMFGCVGVEAAMARGHAGNVFLCVFMGMTTGVGGGILRDLLSMAVPAVLKKRIYAVAVILGCLVYYGLRRTPLPLPWAMMAGMLVTLVIRLCAAYFRWDLPIVHMRDEEGK